MVVGQKERSAVPAILRWTAPEILAHPDADETTSPDVFSTACDVYSFAMLLWELATFTDPFEDITHDSQVCTRCPRVTLTPRRDSDVPFYPIVDTFYFRERDVFPNTIKNPKLSRTTHGGVLLDYRVAQKIGTTFVHLNFTRY